MRKTKSREWATSSGGPAISQRYHGRIGIFVHFFFTWKKGLASFIDFFTSSYCVRGGHGGDDVACAQTRWLGLGGLGMAFDQLGHESTLACECCLHFLCRMSSHHRFCPVATFSSVLCNGSDLSVRYTECT